MCNSDWVAIASLIVTTIALFIAIFGINRANKTTSAATLVALNEGFRQGWVRFLNTDEHEQKHYELAELMNLFEIACAIYLEKSLTGNSRRLEKEYLNTFLKALITSDYARTEVPGLLEDEGTFEFVKLFLDERIKFPSVTVPVEWYRK
jgi:hypothetical protein